MTTPRRPPVPPGARAARGAAGPQGAAALGPFGRTVAALLALIWIAAGTTAIVLGVGPHLRLGLLAGPFAIGYGVLWIRVSVTGQRLRWPRGPRRSGA